MDECVCIEFDGCGTVRVCDEVVGFEVTGVYVLLEDGADDWFGMLKEMLRPWVVVGILVTGV